MAPVTLRYRLDLHDYLALNLYALRSSRSHRLVALAARVWPALAILALLALEGYQQASWFDADDVLIAVAIAAAWSVAVPLFLKWRLRRQLLAYAAANPAALRIGAVEARFGPCGILPDRTRESAKVAWSAVAGMAETKEHLFIFADGSEPVIVPKRRLADRARLDAIRAMVARNVQRAAGGSAA